MENLALSEWLVWVSGGGGAILASWILEKIPAFQAYSSKAKKFISYALAGVSGIGAYALITFAPELVISLEPYFKIASLVFGSIFSGQLFHRFSKA